MISLALPVALGELGWMAMGVVDTMMVGRIGTEAIGATSIGRALFMAVTVAGIGLLLGLDTLVSQAFGAGNLDDCHRSLQHGIYISFALALPATGLVLLLAPPLLARWGIEPSVLRLTLPYLTAVSWSALPIFLYSSARRYLQAMNLVRPVMIALISANLINAGGNWMLIFGRWGAPRLGIAGAGWATVISMCYLAAFLMAVVLLRERERGSRAFRLPWPLELGRMKRLLGLGLPAAIHLALEIGVFAVATLLVGRLDAASLAAHQVALLAASVTFMVPLGISSAAAVRVGQALGRGDPAGSARAGWTALLLGGGFMSLAAVAFVVLPGPLIRTFTSDPGVIRIGVSLLAVAAFFQLFDGLQVVATGALRGAGETRAPMVWNFVGHWLIGLPLGYYLCFVRGVGVIGIWVGLSAGLILIGIVLVIVWWRISRASGDPERGRTS